MIETRAMIAGVLLLPLEAMMEGLESLALEPALGKDGALYLCEADDDGGMRLEMSEGPQGRAWAAGKRGETVPVSVLALGEALAARLDVETGTKVFRGRRLDLWIMGQPMRVCLHEHRGRIDGVSIESPRWMEVLSRQEARRAGLEEKLGQRLEGQG